MNLQFPKGLYDEFSPEMFQDASIRPAVGLVLIINGGILMVNSRHAYDEGLSNYWTVPQEKIEPTDKNIVSTIRRCMHEEFGYLPPEMCFYNARILGDMGNHMPFLRRRNGIHTKIIRFVGVRLPAFPIQLNPHENHAARIVSSWDDLDETMQEVAMRRVQKYTRTCEMTLRACMCGLLHWGIPEGLFSSST